MPPVVANAIHRAGSGNSNSADTAKKLLAKMKRLRDGGLSSDLANKLHFSDGYVKWLMSPQLTMHPRYPGVQVGFISFEMWMAVYDPQREAPLEASVMTFRRMDAEHRTAVMEQVKALAGRQAGRALLSEIAATRHWVRLVPFYRWDLDPTGNALGGRVTGPGTSEASEVFEYCSGRLHRPVVDIYGRRVASVCPPWGALRHHAGWSGGVGQDVVIQYSPQLYGPRGWLNKTLPWDTPDVVLFHELVHAARFMRGVATMQSLTGPYDNEEEYLAIVLEWTLMSEEGYKVFPGSHGKNPPQLDGMDLAHYLQENPQGVSMSPRELLQRFRTGQPTFFDALARIGPKFPEINLVREYAQK
jgi:hypothetical protein